MDSSSASAPFIDPSPTTKLEISKAARRPTPKATKKAPKAKKVTKVAKSAAARKPAKKMTPARKRSMKMKTARKGTWFKGTIRKVSVDNIVKALSKEPLTVTQLAKRLKVSHTGAQNYVKAARKLGKVKLTKGTERQGKRGPLAVTFEVA